MPRSEAYLRAGEQWLLADDPAAAASGFRLAMADGGPVFVDPRVPLARALFQLGRHGEAQALIEKLKVEGRTDPRTCLVPWTGRPPASNFAWLAPVTQREEPAGCDRSARHARVAGCMR